MPEGTSFAHGGVNTLRDKTITAISTPWGEGGIGIVRISGPEAISIADRVIALTRGRKFSAIQPRTVVHGMAAEMDGTNIDEIIAFSFRAPKSYTREDLVEIQAHGGPVVLRRVLQAVLAAGAVLAEPGEFTQRAVLNGRLNLLQAEAVLDLIRAKTNAAAAAALRRLAEGGGEQLLAVEARLLGLSAEIEAWLDFPEDISEPEIDSLAQKARQIMGGLDLLLVEARRGRLLTEGAMVAIVGRPNVGKSSLLNALLGEERAIVTDLPGTTRDAVAEEISLDGLPIRFVDTAGLGQTEDRLETLGMVRSRREIARADLILLVFDASEPLTDADREIATELSKKGQGIAVLNKADLPGQLVEAPEPVSSWPTVAVSALTKHGLPALTGAILNALGGQPAEAVPVLSHLRQIEAAAQARAALAAFAAGLGEGVALDVLAEELRASLASLARITGREVGPDLLREIFSRFCLGK